MLMFDALTCRCDCLLPSRIDVFHHLMNCLTLASMYHVMCDCVSPSHDHDTVADMNLLCHKL